MHIVNLAPPYLCNHQEYWICHGDQNYSDRIGVRIGKSVSCHFGGNSHEWITDSCPRLDLKNRLSGTSDGIWITKYLQYFWTRDVKEKSQIIDIFLRIVLVLWFHALLFEEKTHKNWPVHSEWFSHYLPLICFSFQFENKQISSVPRVVLWVHAHLIEEKN